MQRTHDDPCNIKKEVPQHSECLSS